jgi:hypothetical protein
MWSAVSPDSAWIPWVEPLRSLCSVQFKCNLKQHPILTVVHPVLMVVHPIASCSCYQDCCSVQKLLIRMLFGCGLSPESRNMCTSGHGNAICPDILVWPWCSCLLSELLCTLTYHGRYPPVRLRWAPSTTCCASYLRIWIGGRLWTETEIG